MAESTQHKLDRVRPPRVQITYDVEIGAAIEKKELPFIVGILADLSGKPIEALPPIKDRKFIEIDRDNFNDVLAAMKPHVAFRVPNKLVKDSKDQLNVEFTFKNMDDFNPVELIKQVAALRKLYDGRQRLRDLLTKLDGNDDLDHLLKDVITNTESQAALKKDLGDGQQKPAQ
jgi:type VI secretion system protein ImpB